MKRQIWLRCNTVGLLIMSAVVLAYVWLEIIQFNSSKLLKIKYQWPMWCRTTQMASENGGSAGKVRIRCYSRNNLITKWFFMYHYAINSTKSMVDPNVWLGSFQICRAVCLLVFPRVTPEQAQKLNWKIRKTSIFSLQSWLGIDACSRDKSRKWIYTDSVTLFMGLRYFLCKQYYWQ